MRLLLRFTALASLLGRGNAWAVLDKSSTTNTSAPANGAPWANVGAINGGGGVYVGNGWVLTPYHVYNASSPNSPSITFGLETFGSDGQFAFLKNPNNTQADMVLFHLEALPALPALAISASTPNSSFTLTMIGYGFTRGSAEKTYAWQPEETGFDWSAGTAKSWGTNRVSATGLNLNNTLVFQMNFTGSLAATADEAEATLGDSGAGVFVQRLGVWELAGSIDTIGQVEAVGRDPNLAFNAVYGDVSNAADLSLYRDQITAIISVPEPGVGVWVASLLPLWGGVARPRRRSAG